MDEHTLTLDLCAHIFTNCKCSNMNICSHFTKCILSTTSKKKDRLLPYQIWEAHDIKEQDLQGGIMFFFRETTAYKSYKAQSNQ